MNLPALGQPFPTQQKWASVKIYLCQGCFSCSKSEREGGKIKVLWCQSTVLSKSAELTSLSLSGFAQSPYAALSTSYILYEERFGSKNYIFTYLASLNNKVVVDNKSSLY